MAKPDRRRMHRDRSSNPNHSLVQLETQLARGEHQEVIDSLTRRLAMGKRSPAAWHLLGRAWLAAENAKEAVVALRQAVMAGGDNVAASHDLAQAYFQAGWHDEAVEILRRLIAEFPERVELRRNLVLVLQGAKQLETALFVCRQASEKFPEDASLQRQRGDLCQAVGDLKEAREAYEHCFAIDPQRVDARRRHLALLRRMNEHQAAHEALRGWLAVEPHNPVALHLLAAYQEGDTPARASDDYVRQVFDQFAATFDEQLGTLDYQAPRLIADLLPRVGFTDRRDCQILDAGCGTGWMAPILRPMAASLVGVDLAPQMLAHASRRGLYDSLHEAELTDYLATHPEAFDLVVAADTLIYFGDLTEVIQVAYRALRRPHGWFVFTLESHPGHDDSAPSAVSSKDFVLHSSGRYSHDCDVVLEKLRRAGFTSIDVVHCALRKEAGNDVQGVVIACEAQ